jgi:hypothetical protein
MRAGEAAQPDLTFWVTAATEVAIFKAEIVPKGSQSVKNLGAAAYQTTRDGAGKQGPEAEVSWVTKEKQLVALRFTFAGGQPRSEATALAPKLVELAAKVDPSRL